jgi:hypothetical protein
MSVLTILVVGLIATAYMSLVHWVADRSTLGTRNLLRALGSFMIPEPFRSRGISLGLHFLAGIFFTTVYAFIFDFLEPSTLFAYVETGLLIGLAHGFFLGVFFYGLDPVEGPANFRPGAALINVLSHVVFGLAVGFGMGLTQRTGTVAWFGIYGLAGLIALTSVYMMAGIPVRRRRHHKATA